MCCLLNCLQCVRCLPVLSYRAADNAQCCLCTCAVQLVLKGLAELLICCTLYFTSLSASGTEWVYADISQWNIRNLFAECDIMCGFNEIWSHSLTLCLKCFMGLSCCGDILIFQFLFWFIFITWSASATGFKKKSFWCSKMCQFYNCIFGRKKKWWNVVSSFNSLTAHNYFARILSVYSTVVTLVTRTVCL